MKARTYACVKRVLVLQGGLPADITIKIAETQTPKLTTVTHSQGVSLRKVRGTLVIDCRPPQRRSKVTIKKTGTAVAVGPGAHANSGYSGGLERIDPDEYGPYDEVNEPVRILNNGGARRRHPLRRRITVTVPDSVTYAIG